MFVKNVSNGDLAEIVNAGELIDPDRKSTRLNSSHITISYAVFCLKKKNNNTKTTIIDLSLSNPEQLAI